MKREELEKFLGAKVTITLDNDVYVYNGFLAVASDCGYYYSGDIIYFLIGELSKLPICVFKNYHVKKCTLVPELETDSKSEK
jgi:hypothetical protein